MSKHGILATLLHYRANTVLLKNLPRWRADTIRPYADSATELLPGLFRSVRRGRYYLPGCFPIGETTSAQSADNAISNICK